ncbi:MAG: MarR family transcriptional regulator [Candidatus Eremiobacteraeota bacterium]|nr:MarR family transcriptional regulator [Candidatus Eremiobacteraeota bacterium]
MRLTHAALLANLDLDGNSLSGLAARANMTKQAAGQLAKELQERGYLVIENDEQDARSRTVRFTDAGWKLMLDSFKIIEEIEQRCSQVLGEQTMDNLRTGLAAFIGAHEAEAPAALRRLAQGELKRA